MSDQLFGKDRVEVWSEIGRKFRHGNPTDLKIADQDRMVSLIKDGKFKEATDLLEVLRPLYLEMCSILLEWCMAFAETLRKSAGETDEKAVTRLTHDLWRSAMAAQNLERDSEKSAATDDLLKILAPDSVDRTAERAGVVARLNGMTIQSCDEVSRLLEAGSSEESIREFEKFAKRARLRHDYMCQYLWIFPSVILRRLGQQVSEQVMYDAFESCSTYQKLFPLVLKMSPGGRAAFLAEHLRGHLSGTDRRGAILIEENDDYLSLSAGPCGSGGAMRELAYGQATEGFDTYPEASPATWMRKGEVPVFCAHCAQNESASIRHLGFPAWVADFDPDPLKPCVWRVYKSPERIPDEYFSRIGLSKDPSRFKKPPTK